MMCSEEGTRSDCLGTQYVPEVTYKLTNTVWKTLVPSMHPQTRFFQSVLRYDHSALDSTQLQNGDNNLFGERYLSQESNA